MKVLLIILLMGGAAFLYVRHQREENEKLKASLAEMADSLPESERARLFASKPLLETIIPRSSNSATIRQNVICPQCKAEGSIMVRRKISGTITDTKVMCGLCMGAGKRAFEMPARSEVCPDCGGMGKRVLIQRGGGNTTTPDQGRMSGMAQGGFQNLSPTSTSCVRCLSKGYFIRPGLQ